MSPLAEPLAGVGLVLKATLLLGAGVLAAWLLRRRNADTRHAIWTATIVGLLALPPLSVMLPAWRAPMPAVLSGLASRLPVPARSPVDPRTAPPVSAGRSDESGSTQVSPLPEPGRHPRREVVAAGLLGAWILGAVLVLGLVGHGQLQMRRLVARSHSPGGRAWADEARRAAEVMGVTDPVRVLEAPELSVPVTWGIGRPVVLLPAVSRTWGSARLAAVLRHEFAHIARRDGAIELLAWVVCAIYWFHPGVWRVVRRLRAERERACDDRVVAAGMPAAEYATHLVDVASGLAAPQRRALAALAMASPGRLESRLMDLLDDARSRARLGAGWRAALGFAAFVFVVGAAVIRPAPAAAVADRGAEPLQAARPAQGDSIQQAIAPSGTVHLRSFVLPGDTVSVRASMGSIVVDTVSGSEVLVRATRRTGPRGFLPETRVALNATNRRVVICSVHLVDGKPLAPCEVNDDWGRGSVDDNVVDFHVQVPRGVHLNLMTGLGDLRAFALGGSIRALTGNGWADITADGGATVDAYSGRIDYTMLAGEGSAPVVLRVKHGGIEVRFAPGASASYEVSPGRGTVRVDLPGQRSLIEHRAASGRIGGGRRPLVASLEQGDIALGMTRP